MKLPSIFTPRAPCDEPESETFLPAAAQQRAQRQHLLPWLLNVLLLATVFFLLLPRGSPHPPETYCASLSFPTPA